MFDNVKPDKDGVKRIDLENDILCLNDKNGKLYTDKIVYFLDKHTIYCLLPELEKLLNELQK